MKRIYFILMILFSFGQARAQDKVDFLRTKVDGNRNIVDARLRLSHSLNIPRGASWSLNGAKDSIGYVMFNTTLQRFGVYHGSGVWKAYATIDEIDLLLDGKVDTIHGKGLSTEDYTTPEKSKLAGIAAGAEVNVNADWLAVSGDALILNKPTFVATESDPVFLAQKGVANGVASLNSSGKIPNAQIPALALVDTYVTASQAAMLALSTAEQGDVAIRTDVSKTFILTDNNYSTLASWSELLSPIIPAETDPIWGASPSAGITGTDISNWNTAFGWGNHAGVYLPLTGGTLSGSLTVTNQLNLTGSGSNISGDGNGLIQQAGSNGILSYVNGAYRGIFNGSGNLLIGSLSDHAGERLQVTGDAYISGNLTASSFSGPGTGLTGTASGLTAGAANSIAWTNVSSRPTSLSQLSNDLVYSWALASVKPSYAWSEITSKPTALSSFTNDLGNYGGWITGINSGMVTTALGYTPSNSTYTTSGIATPTFSTITNVSTYTGYDNHYIRVGNEVTVRGKFLLGPTSTGLTVVRISFPTSPDPTRGSDSANGSASGIGIDSGVINMHVGSSSAELSMNASTTFPNEVYYDFTYTAL